MSDKTEYPQVEDGSPLAQYERVMFAQIMLSMARSLRDENLSLAQVAALHLLGLRGEQRVGEVAEAIGMQLPGTSKVLGDLVDRGLCARREDASDRRAKVVSLTPKGRKLIDTIAERRGREASFAMAEIGGEVSDSFNRLFTTLYEAGLTRRRGKSR
jgi:DNA-binding MarR family transcriptional regulator